MIRLIIVGLALFSSASADYCSETTHFTSCDFYQCYQNKTNPPCPTNALGPLPLGAYLIDNGYKYCQRYSNGSPYYAKYDDAGKAFVEKLRQCLIDSITKDYLAGNYTHNQCVELEEYALSYHLGCANSSGFCQICESNLDALLATFTNDDILDPIAAVSLTKILTSCRNYGLSCVSLEQKLGIVIPPLPTIIPSLPIIG